MSIVNLNHQFVAKRHHLMSLMLLGIGIVSIVGVLIYNQLLQKQLNTINEAIEQQHLLDQSRQSSSQSSRISVEENLNNEVVRQAVQRILLPWDELFKGLESADQQDVQLLAIEPNSKSEKLVIKAVSIDSSKMMRYIESLSQQKEFMGIAIKSQSNTNFMGSPMIEFVVEVSWRP